MAITIDTREFEKAITNLISYNKRDASEELNKRARNVIIRAAQLTPKADPKKIEADLVKATVNVTVSKTGRTYKKARKTYIPSLLVYKIIAKKQGLPGLSHAQMSVAAKKFIAARKSSIGFVAYAGWNNALQKFGGRGFGTKKEFAASSAARGSGTPATPESLTAIFINTAKWAQHIGLAPLQESIDLEASEMISHLESKIAAAARRAGL